MRIILNDDEIREALAKALAEKVFFNFAIDPDNCWFEGKAGLIEGDEIEDINDVEFCFDTTSA